MKAVMPEVPPHILESRKRTGADQWDEMWEGVLHMPPVPNRSQQDLEGHLETWLRANWARPRGNKVYHQINLASEGGWSTNYRIPDLVLLTPDRFHIDHNEYFEGAPTVVVEIHSAGDEAYDKMPFYAKLGVPEVWIIDRDSKAPEVYVLARDQYEPQAPDAEGWIPSPATGIQLRAHAGQKLALQVAGEPSTLGTVPED
jgi:Uma2 family endonuclease